MGFTENFLSEGGKSISCEVSSRKTGRWVEQNFEDFARISGAVDLLVVKQLICSSDAGRKDSQ